MMQTLRHNHHIKLPNPNPLHPKRINHPEPNPQPPPRRLQIPSLNKPRHNIRPRNHRQLPTANCQLQRQPPRPARQLQHPHRSHLNRSNLPNHRQKNLHIPPIKPQHHILPVQSPHHLQPLTLRHPRLIHHLPIRSPQSPIHQLTRQIHPPKPLRHQKPLLQKPLHHPINHPLHLLQPNPLPRKYPFLPQLPKSHNPSHPHLQHPPPIIIITRQSPTRGRHS